MTLASVFGLWTSWCPGLAGCLRFAAVAFVVFSSGCGPKLAAVSGRVTFAGKPLPRPGAKILFANVEKAIYITAALDQDGHYRAEMAEGFGLPPGPYDVAVLPPVLGMASTEELEKYRKGGPPPELTKFPEIPMRYRKAQTSGLHLELPPGGTTFDVDMTGEVKTDSG